MSDDDPVSQGQCRSQRGACKELRTLENQNLVLNLRAEITSEIESLRKRIDERFASLLRDLGYVETSNNTPADTCVSASREDHPNRREKDTTLKQRIISWVGDNGTIILLVILAAMSGDALQPYVSRLLDALIRLVEK